MFSPAQRLAHVCLRCQRRLARQTPQWTSPGLRFVDQQPNRFQSTAAARIEDDDEHHESLAQEGSSAPVETSHLQERRYRYRKWRPTPSANLAGHDALGKPSEILILPQRDRDIPVVPTGVEQEAKESLHQTIASEKQPLSWEQIKSNINQIREHVGQQRGQLTATQWGHLQSTLHEGFRNTQLRRYMNETWSRSPAESAALKLATKKRSQLVQLIATKVWSYELPEGISLVVDSPEEERKSKPAKPAKLIFKVRQAVVPSLQLRIQRLCQEFHVRISLKDTKVSIEGAKENVVQAGKAVRAFAKSLICTTIEGDLWLNRFGTLPWSNMLKDLVESLRSIHRLHIQTENSVNEKQQKVAVKVWHSRDDQEIVSQIRHALRMAVAPSARKSPLWRALSEAGLAGSRKLIRIPCRTTAALPLDGTSQYYRVYLAESKEQKLSSAQTMICSSESVLKAANQVLLARLPTTVGQKTANKTHVEYSASFGQALFGYMSSERVDFTAAGKQSLAGRPVFTSEPILIPQLFSHPKLQDAAKSSIAHASIQESQVLVHLRLSPNQMESRWPRLEILLRGANFSAGLLQALEIVRVFAIIEEKTFIIPRPNRAVDVQLGRTIKRELFDVQMPSEILHPLTLESISEYIGDGKALPSLFVDLIVSRGLLHTKSCKVHDSNREAVEETYESVKYVQESLEILDVDTRLAPPASGSAKRYPLEHITSQGGPHTPDRQELVLRHAPDLKSAASAEAELEQFFNSALDVADRLDGLGRQLRHRMEGLR